MLLGIIHTLKDYKQLLQVNTHMLKVVILKHLDMLLTPKVYLHKQLLKELNLLVQVLLQMLNIHLLQVLIHLYLHLVQVHSQQV